MTIVRAISENMIFIRVNENTIFVQVIENIMGDIIWPAGVMEWLDENNISIEYGYIKGLVAGIFLTNEDAIAFRLRFGV